MSECAINKTRWCNKDSSLKVIQYVDEGKYGEAYIAKDEEKYYMIKVSKGGKKPEFFITEGKGIKENCSNATIKAYAVSSVDFDLCVDELPSIVMDYIPGCNLHTMIDIIKSQNYDFKLFIKYKIIFGIAQGIHLLHKKGVTHRDIKPANIFLDPYFNPHLGDFGEITQKEDTANMHGTSQYIPPEAYNPVNGKIPCGPPYDVFEFGCTLFHILALDPPFGDKETDNVLEEFTSKGIRDSRIETGEIPIRKEDKKLYKLVTKCWAQDPKDRPTMKAVKDKILDIAEDNLKDSEYEELEKYAKSLKGEVRTVGTRENVEKAIKDGFAAVESSLETVAELEGIEPGNIGKVLAEAGEPKAPLEKMKIKKTPKEKDNYSW